MTSLLIYGCGNMGGAMLAGWLGSDVPLQVTVVDPAVAEVPAGVRLLRQVPPERFDVVLLGIKPQMLGELAPALAPAIGPGTVLLSVLAGAEIASLAGHFPVNGGIVRVMPNLAAAIGKAPIGLFGKVPEDTARRVTDLMIPLGSPEWLASETDLDAVTALAGSGPAFVYRFIAALAEGGAALGLDSAQAQRLAVSMVEGAAALAAGSGEAPAQLARRVTSAGGTTAAGLSVLDADAALTRLVSATLKAAADRGDELAAAVRGEV
ncbi:MAG: pyrroline-5-carboxylate reductase family protein [Novosphingobium sp.]